MNETYPLSLPTKEFQVAVKNIHKLLSKIKPQLNYPILEVLVKLESVELRLIAMSLIINCKHKNIYSFTIPFHDFYAAAIGTDEETFIAKVSSGEITIGNRSLSSDNIKLFHPENLQKFDLSINCRALDI